ncbi:MAG: hypothetical protein K9L69_02910 [Candidatus Omnitrophica bacterium]|nr:hypothetical protein [Candidatus Omnitrophota bacterium]MCF7895070.1 hypothetical protein [Candidatus Omnitrophota bacterium]
MTKKIALIAAIILPFWNIPLIARMIKRRSSADISLHWALGVWICFILMAPEAFKSSDLVWKTFNIVNLALFSLVIVVVLFYRKKNSSQKTNLK